MAANKISSVVTYQSASNREVTRDLYSPSRMETRMDLWRDFADSEISVETRMVNSGGARVTIKAYGRTIELMVGQGKVTCLDSLNLLGSLSQLLPIPTAQEV